MSLIIGEKINELMKGYPTVSDKYDVAPAVLEGDTDVHFGEPVQFGDTNGYFKAVDGAIDSADKIAGFALATNVKVADQYPGTTVSIKPGEGFNLCIGGFMAIELDSAATLAQCTPNAKVHIILATGKLTTPDKYNAGTIVPLDNVVFTGVSEAQGNTKLAEILIK